MEPYFDITASLNIKPKRSNSAVEALATVRLPSAVLCLLVVEQLYLVG